MTRCVLILAFLLNAELVTAAEPVAAVRQDVGVALLAVNQAGNSVSSDDRVYQLVMGQLQKSFRRADFLVSNAALPETSRPDFSKGLTAIHEAVLALNNSYINTLVLVDIAVTPDSVGVEEQARVQLVVRLYDVSTQSVYRTLHEETIVESDSEFYEVVLRLSDSMTSPTIASIHHAYDGLDPILQVAHR